LEYLAQSSRQGEAGAGRNRDRNRTAAERALHNGDEEHCIAPYPVLIVI
jgi:hypothetical protein